MILLILYIILGFYCTKKTIYANKIVFYQNFGDLFLQRFIYGILFGWVLIPWALIKKIVTR
ncbi:hypothetical protein [[Clostridium] fimetarium]|uniref:Uncharacterized protein n=1 Tax=[Clostridium] fimetarium TaxID=99656 RepID=A0A1I0Q0I7_9FIRM|nr:hypothetical protein [[Clostridium] fimetarium]SEW20376.1 hypothetical protein SAMN05421659_106192 [[Clostridium] fimetarium]